MATESKSKSYARILMNTGGGIIEIIGLSLEFPSMLYLCRDACITACSILEGVPDVLKNGISVIKVDSISNSNYIYSICLLGSYFLSGIALSKFGNKLQSEATISWVESMMYGWKKKD